MSSNIVSLDTIRTRRKDPILNQVEAYWDGLRQGRSVPARADVDPRGLAGVLENCFVAERIAPGMARFRIAGRKVCDLMGQEARGIPMSLVFASGARMQLEDSLEQVFSTPSICRMTVLRAKGFKRSEAEGQLTLLPLRCDLGQVSRVLGCLSMAKVEGPKPAQFDIRSALHTALDDTPLAAPAPQGPVSNETGNVVRLFGNDPA